MWVIFILECGFVWFCFWSFFSILQSAVEVFYLCPPSAWLLRQITTFLVCMCVFFQFLYEYASKYCYLYHPHTVYHPHTDICTFTFKDLQGILFPSQYTENPLCGVFFYRWVVFSWVDGCTMIYLISSLLMTRNLAVTNSAIMSSIINILFPMYVEI